MSESWTPSISWKEQQEWMPKPFEGKKMSKVPQKDEKLPKFLRLLVGIILSN
jgi:hypothetical protein